jgi:Rod binding domain-containing protein
MFVKALDSALPVATVSGPFHPTPLSSGDTKLHAAARQFEAMFMTEMLRLGRPPSKSAGAFAPGQAEKSWQVFMDQALGQAATARSGTGLMPEIEKALRAAQGPHNSRATR